MWLIQIAGYSWRIDGDVLRIGDGPEQLLAATPHYWQILFERADAYGIQA